jgi:CDP-diacylglycerol--glycerol-3-phosphate 3-phosphatidyltransferase
MNLSVALSLFAALGLLGTFYAARVARVGRAAHDRVEAEGYSSLVPKSAMEMFYWLVAPIASACARVGITANAITWSSLGFGLAAGAAFASGELGVGALLASVSAAGDGLDGLIARTSGTASVAGEVLDATIDRYVELAILAGLAIHVRANAHALAVAIVALGGSFMVSYSSAKAEAHGVVAPRGSMRRLERAVLVIGGAALSPIVAWLGAPGAWREAPLLLALAAIAVLSNASAISRSGAIVSTLRRRAARDARADVRESEGDE